MWNVSLSSFDAGLLVGADVFPTSTVLWTILWALTTCLVMTTVTTGVMSKQVSCLNLQYLKKADRGQHGFLEYIQVWGGLWRLYAQNNDARINLLVSGKDHRWRTAGFRARRSTTEHVFRLRIFVRNISSTSKLSTISSATSKKPPTVFDMQLCGQPWRRTTSAPTLSE